MDLTAEVIKGFTGAVLASRFDKPAPIPEFHEELWKMCCLPDEHIAIAAPRGHAKSTSVTLSYVLAEVLFRCTAHVLIVSDTEKQAAQFLGDIAIELEENEELQGLFGTFKFIKSNETEIIVQAEDGYLFRIIARGSEQKLRGLKWRHKRPDLVVGDDLENDEMVMNADRREKFRNWVYKALLPAGNDNCKFRIVGTILHLDSMLERLLNDPSWLTKRYKAHNEDFSEILWPEKFSKERLQQIRQRYINQGMPEGYSQEYLNYPVDEENGFFKREDFLECTKDTLEGKHLYYYSAVDFAITEKERSDYTVICTAGVDSQNRIYIVDIRKGRWDSLEILDQIFSVQERYKPELFTMEAGAIEKAIGPFMKQEMFTRNLFINLNPLVPVKDKKSRAQSIRGRMRAGGVYFKKEDDWYDDFLDECIQFPRAVHDDQVDAFAWIGLTLHKQLEGKTAEEVADDLYEEEYEEDDDDFTGRCTATGY